MTMSELEQSLRRGRGPNLAGPRPGLLTERDLALLIAVYKHRYLSASQVQALLFPSRQTTLRRLKFLATNKYLRAFRVPGIPEQIVGLNRLGAELVAEQLLVPVTELGWSAKTKVPQDPWFMRHHLLTSWFRIRLSKEVSAKPQLAFLGFIPEYLGESQEEGGIKRYLWEVVLDRQSKPREKLAHVPDGVFALGRKDSQGAVSHAALFFLEIDRGTEEIANPDKGVLKTLRFYLSLMGEPERYQRYAQDFQVKEFQGFRILFLTTTKTRVDNIRTVGGRFSWEPERAKRFIWLAPKDLLEQGNVLVGPWRSFDGADERAYTLA